MSKNGDILATWPSLTGIRKKFSSLIKHAFGHEMLTFNTLVIFKAFNYIIK